MFVAQRSFDAGKVDAERRSRVPVENVHAFPGHIAWASNL